MNNKQIPLQQVFLNTVAKMKQKIGLARQLMVDTESWRLYLHDGLTKGGHALKKMDDPTEEIRAIPFKGPDPKAGETWVMGEWPSDDDESVMIPAYVAGEMAYELTGDDIANKTKTKGLVSGEQLTELVDVKSLDYDLPASGTYRTPTDWDKAEEFNYRVPAGDDELLIINIISGFDIKAGTVINIEFRGELLNITANPLHVVLSNDNGNGRVTVSTPCMIKMVARGLEPDKIFFDIYYSALLSSGVSTPYELVDSDFSDATNERGIVSAFDLINKLPKPYEITNDDISQKTETKGLVSGSQLSALATGLNPKILFEGSQYGFELPHAGWYQINGRPGGTVYWDGSNSASVLVSNATSSISEISVSDSGTAFFKIGGVIQNLKKVALLIAA